MKPFITPETRPDGKKAFAYQCEGFEEQELWFLLQRHRVVAYGLPDGHTLEAAWQLLFYLDAGLILEFSSACTQAIGWQEVGSLNIRLTRLPVEGSLINRSKVPPIALTAAAKLIYEDDDVVVECGLVLYGADQQEIVIAAGVSPGSVTVKAPFSAETLFAPLFLLESCRLQPI